MGLALVFPFGRGKSWLDHVLRDQKLKAAIESFKTQQFLQVRGKARAAGLWLCWWPPLAQPGKPLFAFFRLCFVFSWVLVWGRVKCQLEGLDCLLLQEALEMMNHRKWGTFVFV